MLEIKFAMSILLSQNPFFDWFSSNPRIIASLRLEKTYKPLSPTVTAIVCTSYLKNVDSVFTKQWKKTA